MPAVASQLSTCLTAPHQKKQKNEGKGKIISAATDIQMVYPRFYKISEVANVDFQSKS